MNEFSLSLKSRFCESYILRDADDLGYNTWVENTITDSAIGRPDIESDNEAADTIVWLGHG